MYLSHSAKVAAKYWHNRVYAFFSWVKKQCDTEGSMHGTISGFQKPWRDKESCTRKAISFLKKLQCCSIIWCCNTFKPFSISCVAVCLAKNYENQYSISIKKNGYCVVKCEGNPLACWLSISRTIKDFCLWYLFLLAANAAWENIKWSTLSREI